MLQLTAELNTWRVVFFSKGVCFVCVVKSCCHVTSRPNISWFSSPIFFRKISAGDEIQLLIGDLFKFPSVFLCYALSPKKIQIKHLNNLCGIGPLAHVTNGGSKKVWGPFSRGICHQTIFLKASKQDNQAAFPWPRGFGSWDFRAGHINPSFGLSALRSSKQRKLQQFGEGYWESRFGVWRLWLQES